MTDDDLEKSEQLYNTINDFRSDKDRNTIFEKHYGDIDTNIGVKEYSNEETNGSYDLKTNTIFMARKKMPYLNDGFTNIKNNIPLNENQTLAIKDYGHEGVHTKQKNLDKIEYASAIERRLLEALTEMKARNIAINYLEEATKKTRGNPNFRDFINKSETYQNVIKGIDDFCKEYKIRNKSQIINEFIEKTYKDDFDPNNSIKTLMETINNTRNDKIKEETLKEFLRRV